MFQNRTFDENLSKINCSDLCDVCSHVQDLFKALPNYKLSDRIKLGFKQCGGQIKRNVFIVIHKCENNKSSCLSFVTRVSFLCFYGLKKKKKKKERKAPVLEAKRGHQFSLTIGQAFVFHRLRPTPELARHLAKAL